MAYKVRKFCGYISQRPVGQSKHMTEALPIHMKQLKQHMLLQISHQMHLIQTLRNARSTGEKKKITCAFLISVLLIQELAVHQENQTGFKFLLIEAAAALFFYSLALRSLTHLRTLALIHTAL